MVSGAALGEVPVKFFITKNGETIEVRRRRLVNPTYAMLQGAAEQWAEGGRFSLQYTDSDGDTVTLGSQEEWEECQRDLDATAGSLIRLIVDLAGHPRRRGSRCVGRTEHGTRSGGCLWRGMATGSRSERRHRLACVDVGPAPASALFTDAKTEVVNVPEDVAPTATDSPSAVVAEEEVVAEADETKESVEGEDYLVSTGEDIVTRVLSKLYGTDTMERIKRGEVSESSLGCQHWLSIRHLPNGDIDFSVSIADLVDTLAEKLANACAVQDQDEAAVLASFIKELDPETPVTNVVEPVEAAAPTEVPQAGVQQQQKEEAKNEDAVVSARAVYATQIRQMTNMGFPMSDAAVVKLAAFNGNLTQYLSEMLSF